MLILIPPAFVPLSAENNCPFEPEMRVHLLQHLPPPHQLPPGTQGPLLVAGVNLARFEGPEAGMLCLITPAWLLSLRPVTLGVEEAGINLAKCDFLAILLNMPHHSRRDKSKPSC